MISDFVSDANSIHSALHSLEHLPLSQRQKLLHSPTLQNDPRTSLACKPSLQLRAVEKKEADNFHSLETCPIFGIDDSRVEKTSANVTVLAECSTLSAFVGCATVKVEDYQTPSSSVEKDREASIQLDSPTPKVKKEIHEVEDLDHIVLKERLRMLLTGKLPGLSNTVLESSNGGLLETIMEQTLKNGDEQINSANGKAAVVRDQCNDFLEGSNISLPLGATCVSALLTDNASSESKGPVISAGLIEDGPILKSRGIVMQIDSHVENNIINNDGPFSSTSPTFVKVKDEPWDYCENLNVNKDYLGRISIVFPNVKHEREVHNEYHDDQVDHMKLIDRLNFLKSGTDSSLHISTGYSSLKKTRPFSSLSSPIFSKSTKPSSINCRRKRKKTATDSVQEALEEDAPGLLQVLLDKGVLVDEIKLYGEEENDETLDESFGEDSFSEFEAVMAKISSERHTFLKFPFTRCSKTSRASYCFACLFSLVEQTRYLKFRKWPVEWGWCRDLQSFIFVFERHNRIVLERPEYGFATYFFELVESLPVQWQVKRLVIAMKLTTCSRISIIENKELVVGEDLSEGEAEVLMKFGWTPSTGLGTMLNYCDRVVHDRKNEDFSSEWRSKIGKLLVDGYKGGTKVKPNVPIKDSQSPVIDSSCSTPMSD
ncbi:uncharacterized protein LOC106764988 isoform X2 [Vigna radiata var. radiata]|uniref:Uncharacterized protein LOC106764988 isoform X2 n=1 Tax=Vigna radiata var. radiata TaxID=3916 RepID=A0A1S3UFY2_VIGRR|nr:uncharacterized protein LOC106764988 isoform X2 [Vigna radiata var. radiata]